MTTATHSHDSQGTGIPDTVTTLELGTGVIHGKVKMVAGLRYWSRPSAATLRRWADELLAGTGMARDGAIEYRTGGPVTEWSFIYRLKSANN